MSLADNFPKPHGRFTQTSDVPSAQFPSRDATLGCTHCGPKVLIQALVDDYYPMGRKTLLPYTSCEDVTPMSETPAQNDSPSSPDTGGVSRRTVVKLAAAAGVGAGVWAEPTIKGFARRPAYASSGSSTTTTTVTLGVNIANPIITITSASPNELDGVPFAFTDVTTNGNGNLIFIGPVDAFNQVSVLSVDVDVDNIVRSLGGGVVDGRITFRSLGTRPDGDYVISVTMECVPI